MMLQQSLLKCNRCCNTMQLWSMRLWLQQDGCSLVERYVLQHYRDLPLAQMSDMTVTVATRK
jgi:hypothetical protein